MESICESSMFDKLSENIKSNISNINKLLTDCEIRSHIVTQNAKIVDILAHDQQSLMKDEPRSEYYDLEQVSNIFEMLDSTKPEGRKKMKSARSESAQSLTSSSGRCLEDLQVRDHTTEITSRLNDIRSIIESIKNSDIKVAALDSIKDKETAKNTKFVDMIFNLQKIAKELQSIATTIDYAAEVNSLEIDQELISDLRKLSQVTNLSQILLCSIIELLCILSDTHRH